MEIKTKNYFIGISYAWLGHSKFDINIDIWNLIK